MYGFKALIFALVPRWMAQGVELTALKRGLFMAAILWTTFWWMLIPAIVGFFLLIAIATSIVCHFRKKPATAASATAVGQ